MFKRTKAARQILNSTKHIKALVVSSLTSMTQYLNLGKDQGYIEDVSNELIFKKKLSEFDAFKATNSCSDFGMIQKEGNIDCAAVRKLIYARCADEIGKQGVEPIKEGEVQGFKSSSL